MCLRRTSLWQITIYEGRRWPQHPEKSLLVLEFTTEKGARLWLKSDPKFKQQDWPHVWDSADVLMLPLTYIPTAGKLSYEYILLMGLPGSSVSSVPESQSDGP